MYKIFSNYYRKNCARLPIASVIPQNGAIRFAWQYPSPYQSTPVPTKQMPCPCKHHQQGLFVPRQDYPTHVPMPPDSLFIGNIRRRCHRKSMRKTLRVNRYMPLDTANFLAGIVAFSMAVSAFCMLCASIIRKGVFSWRPCLRRAAAT